MKHQDFDKKNYISNTDSQQINSLKNFSNNYRR